MNAEIVKFFGGVVGHWRGKDTLRRRRFVRKYLVEWLDAPDSFLLDLGCGTGIAAHAMVEGGYDPGKIVMVDVSMRMLETAGEVVPEIARVCAWAEKLPFDNGSFDRVLIFDALPHMGLVPVLREINRVLRPGGEFVILHDNCHYRINMVHRQLPRDITLFELPRVADMASTVSSVGFAVIKFFEEREKVYYLRARAV